MTNTPFQNLRDKLRANGCRLECAMQSKAGQGAVMELWMVYPEGCHMPVRCMILDEREEGYHLFIENAGISIDGDVQAILRADLAGRLEKA